MRRPGVELGLRGGEEAVAEAQRHRAGHDGQAQVEQVGDRCHGPAHQRARAPAHASVGVGRPAGRSTAAIAVPDASASRQPRRAARARPAVGLDDDVADVAGVARRPVEQPAVDHDPAAHARRHDHGEVVARAAGRARPTPRPGASALASLSTNTGSPVSPASRARSGKLAPGGDVQRRHRRRRPASSARRSPRRTRPRRPGRDLGPTERGEPLPQRLGVAAGGRGARCAASGRHPAAVTRPTASFVPPMSTARPTRRWLRMPGTIAAGR